MRPSTGGSKELPTQSCNPPEIDPPEIDIEFRGVTKRFGDIVAVDEVSLAVERGSFFSFLGPSGCGKTPSLRLIAGFEQPARTGGAGGRAGVGLPPYTRPANMVVQNDTLFPTMDAERNDG